MPGLWDMKGRPMYHPHRSVSKQATIGLMISSPSILSVPQTTNSAVSPTRSPPVGLQSMDTLKAPDVHDAVQLLIVTST